MHMHFFLVSNNFYIHLKVKDNNSMLLNYDFLLFVFDQIQEKKTRRKGK